MQPNETCIDIGSDIAGTQYDVAHVKWGGSWRMPSKDQMKELCDKCTNEWVTMNGVNGQMLTGPNGRTIFLPAAGERLEGGDLYLAGSRGAYWSSSQTPKATSSYYLYFYSIPKPIRSWSDRANGHTVRPVSR